MLRLAVIATLVSATLFAARAHAQEDFLGVRAEGMGEALRANASGTAGPLLNPAGMSLTKGYVIEGAYGFNVEQLGHRAHVSVVDSATSRVAAGLFYSFVYAQPKIGLHWAGGFLPAATLTREGHAAGLALSVALGDYLIIGATAKYLNISTTAPLPKGTVPSNLTLDSVNGVTFDFGLLLRLGDRFHLAAVGYNLWDHGSRESPLSLGFGLAYLPTSTLTIGFDTVVNFTGYQSYHLDNVSGRLSLDQRTTARLGPGIEWVVANKVPLRLGLIYDSGLPGTFLTAGLGFQASSFAIDLSYRGKVQGGVENLLLLGIRIFIN